MLYIITVGAISLCLVPKQQLGSLPHIQHLTSQSTLDSSTRYFKMNHVQKYCSAVSTFRGSTFKFFESGCGHRHAVAVSDGSGRPEKPAGCGWRWACWCGARGAAHWCLYGEQQRLCHQSHTRSRAKSLHTDGRLGHGGFQVNKYTCSASITLNSWYASLEIMFSILIK